MLTVGKTLGARKQVRHKASYDINVKAYSTFTVVYKALCAFSSDIDAQAGLFAYDGTRIVIPSFLVATISALEVAQGGLSLAYLSH